MGFFRLDELGALSFLFQHGGSRSRFFFFRKIRYPIYALLPKTRGTLFSFSTAPAVFLHSPLSEMLMDLFSPFLQPLAECETPRASRI